MKLGFKGVKSGGRKDDVTFGIILRKRGHDWGVVIIGICQKRAKYIP